MATQIKDQTLYGKTLPPQERIPVSRSYLAGLTGDDRIKTQQSWGYAELELRPDELLHRSLNRQYLALLSKKLPSPDLPPQLESGQMILVTGKHSDLVKPGESPEVFLLRQMLQNQPIQMLGIPAVMRSYHAVTQDHPSSNGRWAQMVRAELLAGYQQSQLQPPPAAPVFSMPLPSSPLPKAPLPAVPVSVPGFALLA